MSRMDYLRIFADRDGCSHFETKSMKLQSKEYAPPAPALNTSPLEAADNYIFLELPVGWYGDWHPTPVRQWLIFMAGMCEFEAGDGQITTCKTGDVVLLDDTRGKGQGCDQEIPDQHQKTQPANGMTGIGQWQM